MPEGIIVKAFSNFFTLAAGEAEYLCTLRGRLKREHRRILTGDRAEFTPLAPARGVVEAILHRTTEMVRPPIANVDQVIIVVAVERPEVNLQLLDKMLVLAEQTGIGAQLCVNKADRITAGAVEDFWMDFAALYRQAGYPVLFTSTRTKQGIAELRRGCDGKVSVLAGVSGAGKSSLLNALHPGLALKTGELSDKLGRGRHTTRQVELLRLGADSFVADTPGFSTVELQGITAERLAQCFPEIRGLSRQCRFSGCRHWSEPDCAVKAAVADKSIDARRYGRYIEFLAEISAGGRN